MENYETIVVGGGVSGLIVANKIKKGSVLVLERNDRVGKKLSASGNGQGNLTNRVLSEKNYFSSDRTGKIGRILQRYGNGEAEEFYSSFGAVLIADEKGRVYPAGRQASAITDLLRFSLKKKGVEIRLGEKVVSAEKRRDLFCVKTENGEFYAKNLVICTGGKASKNFGTDGFSYALCKAFSHTVTALSPSLVQLKTETDFIKGLKGIRIQDARVSITKNGSNVAETTGDIIFTEYGVSGDAVFRLSAYYEEGTDCFLSIDPLPETSEEELVEILEKKKKTFGAEETDILCGIVNNSFGRAIVRRAGSGIKETVKTLKNYSLKIKGTLGFDYAQVTKGGVPLDETDDNMQSKKVRNLFFAGEINDVDGECGGYNLQWAFSSASVIADKINGEEKC